MNIWHLRKAEKIAIDCGKWQTGKMPKNAFPMSKSRAKVYRLGSAWQWCVMTFQVSEKYYRILVAFRTDKEQFLAKLAVDDGGDMKLIARLEFHGTHGGWHVHYTDEPMRDIPSGVVNGPWVRRKECLKHKEFGFLSANARSRALTITSQVFGIPPSSDGFV